MARAYARMGQTIASSMELGVSKSRLLGIGLEYADFREYQEGDDAKYIDWALSARSVDANRGDYKLYTKVFHVEQLKKTVYVIDLSNSMLIEDKLAAEAYIASLTLELSHRLLDRVDLVLMGGKVEVYRGLRGREAIRVIENTLCRESEIGGVQSITALSSILRVLIGKNTQLVLITDYAHDPEEYIVLGKLRRATGTPILVYLVVYKWEVEKPVDRAFLVLVDSENPLSYTGDLDELYRAVKTHVVHVKSILAKSRVNHLEVVGLMDATAKTVRIIDLYLKTRERQVIQTPGF